MKILCDCLNHHQIHCCLVWTNCTEKIHGASLHEQYCFRQNLADNQSFLVWRFGCCICRQPVRFLIQNFPQQYHFHDSWQSPFIMTRYHVDNLSSELCNLIVVSIKKEQKKSKREEEEEGGGGGGGEGAMQVQIHLEASYKTKLPSPATKGRTETEDNNQPQLLQAIPATCALSVSSIAAFVSLPALS